MLVACDRDVQLRLWAESGFSTLEDPMTTQDHLWDTTVTTGTQLEIAQYVLAAWRAQGDVVYCDRFYQYNNDSGTWNTRPHDACRRDVLALSGRTFGAKRFSPTGDVKQSRIRMTDNICNSVLRVAASLANPCTTNDESDFFDDAPVGVLCKGTFLTIEGGNVVARPPTPHDRQRTTLDIPYNPGAKCPTWARTLTQWFGDDQDGVDKAALLGEFVGAALFGVATRYQKALFVIAPGGNGKSQLLDVVSALFPSEHTKAVRPQDWGNEYQRAELARAMVNIVAELPGKAIAEGSNFKAIITGDPLSARRIYEKPFTVRPRCAHIFSGNAFPDAMDTSDGFWRRIMVLTMTRRFDGTPEEVQDLAKIIIGGELEGVMAWAVRGAVRLLTKSSYTIPESSKAEVATWRRQSDPVALWLDRRTQPSNPEQGTLTNELFFDYDSWRETYRFPELNLNNFSKALARLCGSPKRTKIGRQHPLLLKTRTGV